MVMLTMMLMMLTLTMAMAMAMMMMTDDRKNLLLFFFVHSVCRHYGRSSESSF